MAKFELSPVGQVVWEDRYGQKDENGKLIEKNITGTFSRVAKAVASKEKQPDKRSQEFYDVMLNGLFCPAGRVLAHAGTHYSQLLNCFVLPFEDDSLESIMATAKDMAVIQKYGGGCVGGESLVLTDKGPMSIKDIVEKKEDIRVLSYNPGNKEMEYCNVLDRHTTELPGERVYEVEFDDLRGGVAAKIRASDWHPFFVFDGEEVIEVRADELKPGMAVIGSTDLNTELDDWGWLLGYIAGDGSVNKNGSDKWNRIRIVDMNEACIARASNVMGVSYRLSTDERYDVDVWACESYADVAGKIKKEYGGFQNAFIKHVPESVWKSDAKRRFSFLVGYFDADGHFNKEKKRFDAFTVSKDLAQGIIALAGSLGIRASKRFRKSSKENVSDGWEVRLSSSQFITDSITNISAKYQIKDAGWVCGVIDFSHAWKNRLKSAGVNVKSKEAWRKKVKIGEKDLSLVYWLQYGKATRETSAAILRQCGEDRLASAILSSQIVLSSKVTHESETLYDLTVEKNQNYLASDPETGAYIVVHNTGFTYSPLRPAGSYIKGVNGRSCGTPGFIGMMSTVSEVIEQGGSRRGANMGVLDVWHPDIWEFITYKNEHNWDKMRDFIDVTDQEKWSYFKYENLYKWQMYNVSVAISDEFLEALEKDEVWPFMWEGVEWELYKVVYKKDLGEENFAEVEFEVTADSDATAIWKVKRKVPYPKGSDKFEVISRRKVKAAEVWDIIAYNAWADGCPGIINLSEMRRMHNLEYTGTIGATNPCGEQPLPAYASCNLSSIPVNHFVTKQGEIDWDTLRKTVYTAVRFSDNVIDNCEFPLPEVGKKALQERRVGMGIMGTHDMLIQMGIGYDTQEGRDQVESVLIFIRNAAYKASVELAVEKGPFPAFNKKNFMKSGFVKTLPKELQEEISTHGIRNGTLLSQAPTGTISALMSVSSGPEPWPFLSFTRNTRLGSYEDGCAAYLKWKEKHPDEEKPSYFKSAQEISPEDHVKMMIVFSKYMDSAVSKTINLPNSATVEDVKDSFLLALKNGVKGLTVFRDGSKEGVLVGKDKKEILKKAQETVHELQDMKITPDESRTAPKKRGGRTAGSTYRVHLQKHNLYVTVNRNMKGELVEVFATVGENKTQNQTSTHTSGVEDSWAEGLAKMISLALRAGVGIESIIRNLKFIPSDKPVFTTIGDREESEMIPSPPHAIARAMEEELYDPVVMGQHKVERVLDRPICERCGSNNTVPNSPTCYKCLDCEFGKCD